MWKENLKIIDIVDEKIFQLRLKTEKEKPRLVERGGICLRENLVEEGFGWNKVLCNFLTESNCQ